MTLVIHDQGHLYSRSVIEVETRTRSRRERKKAENRGRLCAAAKALFRERGYDDVTVSEITERADLSKGTFFNYYESKAHVLLDYAREVSVGLLEYGRRLRGADTRDLLGRVFARMDRVFREEGTLVDVLVRELPADLALQEAHRRGGHALLDLYRDFFERGMKAGKVRADLDPALAAELVRDVWLSTLRAWVASGRGFSLKSRATKKLGFLFEGLETNQERRKAR